MHVGLLVLGGCGVYPTGLQVQSERTESSTERHYKIVEGAAPLEQKGTLGEGDACEIAAASTGTLTTSSISRTSISSEVVGQTEAEHPLLPGREGLGPSTVSIIQQQEILSATHEITESFYSPEENPSSWETFEMEESGPLTSASSYGVVKDEYIVRLELADLWSDFTELRPDQVTLMTRHSPRDGDIWVSLDGRHLYRFAGAEEITLAEEQVKADAVEIYSVADADPEGGSLIGQCLHTKNRQTETTQPGETGESETFVELDAGCTGQFTHLLLGTEWWYRGWKIAEEVEETELTVDDFGYEWFELDGQGCTRKTDTVRRFAEARLFIQYRAVTTRRELWTSAWEP